MATKLILACACISLCNASPVYLRSYLFRNGRGYSVGQGYTNNAGGRATGSATINGGVIQAYGSANSDGQNQLRNSIGAPFPGAAVANAEVYDMPGTPGVAKAVAEVQNTPNYYTVPAPATIVAYEQNFDIPAAVRYKYPGIPEAITSAKVEGSGSAQSTAKTQGIGSYGMTSSNTETFGSGVRAVSSNANNDYGVVNTAARTQGYGSASSKSESGLGSTSAATHTNGGYASSSANNALSSAVVSANSQGIASSKADINSSQGVVVNSAKSSEFKGWRFGTTYTVPIPGQSHVASQVNGGAAKSTAHTDGVVTNADAQGYGSANANAKVNGGHVNSAANSNSLGYGAARYTAGNGYGSAISNINNGLGNIKSSANSNGYGNANSHADINNQGSLLAVSNSNGHGTAASSANTAPSFAAIRSDGLPYIYNPRTNVNTQTFGQGSASARTQGLNTGYKVINSAANSFGYGSAQANASA